MESNEKKLCIVGTGGFGRETLLVYIDTLNAKGTSEYRGSVVFMESDQSFNGTEVMGIPVIRQSEFDPNQYRVVVGIGDPATRKKVVAQLPGETEFTSLIHPTAVISDWVSIGAGSVVTAGTIVTCNIKLGKHTQLNLHTTIGHDCTIGNYFTTAPGAKISGICEFGECVYFGTSAIVRQGIKICDNVTIGMGGVVVKDIDVSGVYVGNPVKRLEKHTRK
ncbi:hypothetical protein AB833_25975 [Chromatiales bacterium (ex Bugula neritina AB1)]|nr:hypothetical protein AB833_25975 [Chromatiales bacterium (ex Bugula neritina AB1)]